MEWESSKQRHFYYLDPLSIPATRAHSFQADTTASLHPAASLWHRRALLCHGCDSQDNDSVLTSRPHAGLRREHAGVCAGVACTAVVARGLGHVAACAALGWHLHLGAAGASTFVAHEDKRRRTENGGHNGRAPLAQNYPRRHGSPGACKQLFCGGSHSSGAIKVCAAKLLCEIPSMPGKLQKQQIQLHPGSSSHRVCVMAASSAVSEVVS